MQHEVSNTNCPSGGMVDAFDLKSNSLRECRFESGLGHQEIQSCKKTLKNKQKM